MTAPRCHNREIDANGDVWPASHRCVDCAPCCVCHRSTKQYGIIRTMGDDCPGCGGSGVEPKQNGGRDGK